MLGCFLRTSNHQYQIFYPLVLGQCKDIMQTFLRSCLHCESTFPEHAFTIPWKVTCCEETFLIAAFVFKSHVSFCKYIPTNHFEFLRVPVFPVLLQLFCTPAESLFRFKSCVYYQLLEKAARLINGWVFICDVQANALQCYVPSKYAANSLAFLLCHS